MIATFKEYQDAGGTAITSEESYTPAEARAETVIDAYIKTVIPFWKVQKLEDYGLDFKAAIFHQLDYLEAHGGSDALAGNSDLALKGVTTSGFTYTMDSNMAPMLYNIPLSPIAKTEIDYPLLESGLSGKAIW